MTDEKRTVAERPQSRPSRTPAAPSSSAFDPPAQASERYDEKGEIGRGGMGRVAEAVDTTLGRDVAIKHMLSTDEVAIARFEREARITARLEHPSIVPLYDAGRNPDGTPFYVMRRVDGRPLDQFVEDGVRGETLIPNILAACDAVAFAHARGIIHRDIKPTNILVGSFGETLLIDWGLARETGDAPDVEGAPETIDEKLTRVGQVAGTPGFMSPEQARGEPVDGRADVFALGATLFFVLARMPPYSTASSGTEMIVQAAANRAPEWDRLPKETPADLRAIIVKAMAPRAADRYADAGALAKDLRSFVTGHLVGAHRYGRFEQLGRLVRRHRAALLVATAFTIVLGVFAFLSIGRIVDERDQANTARALAEQRQREALVQADDQLVHRAHELLSKDALAAVALLRRLRPESPKWPDAAIVAEGARLRSVPFGFTTKPIAGRPEIARGIPRAFAIDRLGGMTLFDLAARTARELEHLPPGERVFGRWLGARIARLDDHELVFIDGATGTPGARIPVPGPIDMIYGNNDDTLWIRSGATVYRLVDAARWEPFLTEVDDVTPSSDLSKAVVRHARGMTVWTSAGEFPLRSEGRFTASAISGDVAIVSLRGVITTYDISSGTAKPLATFELPFLRQVGFLGSTPIAINATEMVFLRKEGVWKGHGVYDALYQTDRGTVAATIDGALELDDQLGRTAISRTNVRYRLAQWSPDGRFVMATTMSGDAVLCWDLDGARPISLPLATSESLIAMTHEAVWIMSDISLKRFDIAASKLTTMPNLPMPQEVAGSHDGRFAITRSLEGITLYDLPGARTTRIANAVAFNSTIPNGVAYETADNVIHAVDAASPEGRVVRRLAFSANYFALVDGRLTLAGDGFMEFVDLANDRTRRVEVPGRSNGFALTRDGAPWLIIDGALYRVGDSVAKIEDLPSPCVEVLPAGDFVVVRCNGALFRVSPTTPIRPIAGDVATYDTSSELTAFQREHGEVMVASHASDLLIELPALSGRTSDIRVEDDRIGYQVSGGVRSAQIWRFHPATSEAELRDRLLHMTNAITRGDTEASTWPNR